MPGSPLDPRARGPNNLIRQGAILVESTTDVIDALAQYQPSRLAEPTDAVRYEAPAPEPPDESALRAGRAVILGLLGPTPVSIDELIRQSRLTPALTVTILLELELAGRLDQLPGGLVALRAASV